MDGTTVALLGLILAFVVLPAWAVVWRWLNQKNALADMERQVKGAQAQAMRTTRRLRELKAMARRSADDDDVTDDDDDDDDVTSDPAMDGFIEGAASGMGINPAMAKRIWAKAQAGDPEAKAQVMKVLEEVAKRLGNAPAQGAAQGGPPVSGSF